ncbi:MAG: hypothetical protein Q8N95_13495 [Desulfobacterales bacterium]|nr:hypothetical protein [Desulfobacterales bacterium]
MFKIITVPFDRATKGFDDELLCRFVLNKNILSYQALFTRRLHGACKAIRCRIAVHR